MIKSTAALRVLACLTCLTVCLTTISPARADHHEENVAAKQTKVIRRAVAIQFKETSSKEDIQGAVKAFDEMVGKIDVITNYDFGPLFDSPYKGNFTHLFTVSFADQAGLDAYNEHPAHMQELVGVMRPVMADLLVLDYPTTTVQDTVKGRVRHVFLVKVKEDVTDAEIAELDARMQAVGDMDVVKEYEWGVGNAEDPLSKGFSRCYVFNFADMAGLQTYAKSEQHDLMGAALGAAKGEKGEILALDITVQK